jgi:hypothetical protein
MRVCVVGNSHVRCWKQGHQYLSKETFGKFELTFYGALRVHLEELALLDGRLVPSSESGKTDLARYSGMTWIDPKDYDAFIVVGMALNFDFLWKISREFSTRRLNPNAQHLISEACFKALLGDLYGLKHPAIQLVRKIRKTSTCKIILAPAPCPSETAARFHEFSTEELYASYVKFLRSMSAKRDFVLLEQNPRTMVSPGLTARSFGIDRPGDNSHMNARYGRIMLADALTLLVGGAPTGPGASEERVSPGLP